MTGTMTYTYIKGALHWTERGISLDEDLLNSSTSPSRKLLGIPSDWVVQIDGRVELLATAVGSTYPKFTSSLRGRFGVNPPFTEDSSLSTPALNRCKRDAGPRR